MTRMVSKADFKARALECFRWVERTGKPLVVTDRGHPVIKITPYREATEDALAPLRGSVLRYDDPLEPVGVDDWEALR